MSHEYAILRQFLSDRLIAFSPTLARAVGGINEAILLQQLAFWSDKGADPDWIYKTQKELEAETTLTRTQQERARKQLRSLGVVSETKKGLPAKLYFKVEWGALFALLERTTGKDAGNLQPRMRERRGPARAKPATKPAAKLHPITERTPENTREDGKAQQQKPLTLDELAAETERFETERAKFKRLREAL